VCSIKPFSSAVAIRIPPAVAGGEIRFFNRVLQAQAEVVRSHASGDLSTHLVVVLDKALFRSRHQQVRFLNEKGDVVLSEKYPKPLACFSEAHAHFRHPTRGSIESHALAFWKKLLLPIQGQACLIEDLEDSTPQCEIGLDDEQTWPNCAFQKGQRITWFSTKHLNLLSHLQLNPEDALMSEKQLKKRLVRLEPNALQARFAAIRNILKSELAELQPIAEQESAKLLGAWSRLRRDLNQGLSRFEKSAERAMRNHRGIQDFNLHALCQAMRPHNSSQEQGLSLLAAAAQFNLPTDSAIGLYSALMHDFCVDNLLLSTEGDYLGRI